MDILTPELKAPKKDAMVGVRLESEYMRRLEALAKDRRISISELTRLMIKHMLDRVLLKTPARKSK